MPLYTPALLFLLAAGVHVAQDPVPFTTMPWRIDWPVLLSVAVRVIDYPIATKLPFARLEFDATRVVVAVFRGFTNGRASEPSWKTARVICCDDVSLI